MTYLIECGIPIRGYGRGRGSAETDLTRALRSLKIGESFHVPDKLPHQINGTRQRIQRETGLIFITRREGDGTRVWLLK